MPQPNPAWPAAAPPGTPAQWPQDTLQWAMIAHLSGLSGLVTGMPFLGPLIVYLVKKDENPIVVAHAKEALNFQLSVTLYLVLGVILCVVLAFIVIGFFLIPVVAGIAIAGYVMAVIAGLKAQQGLWYRYPATIRFLN